MNQTTEQIPSERACLVWVDDSADERRYVSQLLEEKFEIVAVADGRTALEAIRSKPPDLVLADVMMPGLDGFALVRELRADPQLHDIPVVLISGRADEEARIESMEAGADDYLIKPFSPRELLARIESYVRMTRARRAASRALRASQERLRIATDAAGLGVFEWNIAQDHTVWENERMYDIFGHTRTDGSVSKQQFIESYLHPEDVAAYQQALRAGMQPGAGFHCVCRIHRKSDASLRWIKCAGDFSFAADGTALKLVGVVTDITERKQAEQVLRDNEEQLMAILDQLPVVVGVTNCDGEFILSNSLMRNLVPGKLPSHDPRRGKRWRSLDAEGRPIAPEQWPGARALRGEVVNPGMEFLYTDDEGRHYWLLITAVPLRRANADIVGAIWVAQDVTERKRTEEALRDADRRKDQFLATLAHELRNPLAPLRNGLEMMKLAGNTDESFGNIRAMMERQLAQMVRLIDDLLDVSRISRGRVELRKERVELSRVLTDAVETTHPLIEQAGHELIIDLPADPITVDADPTRLSQVFSNLLNNAAKFTDQGGHIRLSVERRDGEAVVAVRDSGIGIPAAMLPRVFDLFTQEDSSLEKSRGGLGIGLSLVKQLVGMHNGRIEVSSEGQGKGSEFSVYLALAEPGNGQQTAGADAGTNRHLVKHRILVTDDNKDAATSLAMILNMLGHDTQTAYDGLEALAVAAAFKPDVILLDIGMPGLNGYDTARRIREQPWGKAIVLVALTGWGQEEDRRQSQESGFNFHLVKPIDLAVLEKLLGELDTLPQESAEPLQN